MEDFAARFADALEMVASRVRALTIDRVSRVIRLTTMGMTALTLALVAAVFLVLAIFGALAIPLGNDGAFAVLGLIALIGGIVAWWQRKKVQ